MVAGAGSGKTRVLTHRIAHLIRDRGVDPERIMAITFTNRATNEMKARVLELVGAASDQLAVSTFHKAGTELMRRHADQFGYSATFKTLPQQGRNRLLRAATEAAGCDLKQFPVRTVGQTIALWKRELLFPEDVPASYPTESNGDLLRIYRYYSKLLAEEGMVDVDDLLLRSVRLLRDNPEVRSEEQCHWQHVLVDEFQDSNQAQHELVRWLLGTERNVFAVGDADQSIYAFLGAVPANVHDFNFTYPEVTRYVLEQNYRSTKTILAAANHLIAFNSDRIHKELWTTLEEDAPIEGYRADDAEDEAEFVVEMLRDWKRRDRRWPEAAILYRVNAQSRAFEDALATAEIPHRLLRGVGFYERAEIMDAVAFIRFAINPSDHLSARRVANKPRRGAGDFSLELVATLAAREGLSFLDGLRRAEQAGVSERALDGIAKFVAIIDHLRALKQAGAPPKRILEEALERSGYLRQLRADSSPEGQSRLQNVEEFVASAHEYDTLQELSEDVERRRGQDGPAGRGAVIGAGLAADERPNTHAGRVALSTLHSAKGLEFEVVFMVGLTEGLLPSAYSLEEPSEIEEERRLAFVGITRAKRQLYFTYTDEPELPLELDYGGRSRFIDEIPSEFIRWHKPKRIGRGEPPPL